MHRVGRALFSLVAALSLVTTGARGQAPGDTLTIIAPGSRGGGWDQVALAMQRVLQQTGLVAHVEVENSPGAGGAIALGQFIAGQKGDAHTLLVGGLTMLQAVRTTGSTVSLDQTTSVARLIGEYEVIAVPAGSELRTLDDLVQALRVNPGSISWAGGSGGGTDQILINELARAIGVEPVRMTYVPFSGGAEVENALLHHEVSVGVSGWAEFSETIAAGRLLPLAISSDQRLPGVAIPTLKEQGIDRSLVNWRGVFAPPNLSPDDAASLTRVIEQMVRADAWRAELKRYHWTDLYMPSQAFAGFILEEQARAAVAPDPRGTTPAARPGAVWTTSMWLQRNRVPIGAVLFLAVGLGIAVGVWQRLTAIHRHRELSHQLERAEREAQQNSQQLERAEKAAKENSAQAQDLLRGMGNQMERQLDAWRLTAAEKEVATLMLKGLRHKEIASIRDTSERTVRQQALAVYRKAGIEGRSELAAYFFEDFLPPNDARIDTSDHAAQPSRKPA
jgi:putative tricarboxylic transport membrane protein